MAQTRSIAPSQYHWIRINDARAERIDKSTNFVRRASLTEIAQQFGHFALAGLHSAAIFLPFAMLFLFLERVVTFQLATVSLFL